MIFLKFWTLWSVKYILVTWSSWKFVITFSDIFTTNLESFIAILNIFHEILTFYLPIPTHKGLIFQITVPLQWRAITLGKDTWKNANMVFLTPQWITFPMVYNTNSPFFDTHMPLISWTIYSSSNNTYCTVKKGLILGP